MKDNLAEDWVALWQSELTAMAADRELRESWTVLVTLWAGAANTAFGMMRTPYDPARRTAISAQPAGTAPVAAASEPGVDEVERLNLRIAELEQRLAALERNGDSAAGGGRGAAGGISGDG